MAERIHWWTCETSSFFDVDNSKNETILRDVCSFWTWHLSPCLSASLKTKQFCETSSIFRTLTTSKTKAILRDVCSFWTWQPPKWSNSARLLQFVQRWQPRKQSNSARLPCYWKVKSSSDSLVPISFAIYPLHLSKVLRLPRKIDARSYEVLHLSRRIILANLHIWYSKMQPPSGNQRPDLLTSLMNISFVLCLPQKMHLCRSSSNAPRLPWFLEMRQNPHVLLTFDKVHNPLRLPRETSSECPKVVRTWCVSYILTSKCASRTTACTFSTSQLPKVVRSWCALYILTSKCVSRHILSLNL